MKFDFLHLIIVCRNNLSACIRSVSIGAHTLTPIFRLFENVDDFHIHNHKWQIGISCKKSSKPIEIKTEKCLFGRRERNGWMKPRWKEYTTKRFARHTPLSKYNAFTLSRKTEKILIFILWGLISARFLCSSTLNKRNALRDTRKNDSLCRWENSIWKKKEMKKCWNRK